MSERAKRLSRRNFLLAAGAGGVAGAAALVAKNSPVSESPSSAQGKRATRGYQTSEHVNNYYRTTKV